MDDTQDEDVHVTTNNNVIGVVGDHRNDANKNDDAGASTTTTAASSAPSTSATTTATSSSTADSSQRSWTDSALVRDKQGVAGVSSPSSSSRRTPTSATRRVWTNNSGGRRRPAKPASKQQRSSSNTGGDLSIVEEKRQLAHRSTRSLRVPQQQQRRRNDVIRPPTSPGPASSRNSGVSSPVDSTFVSAKQQLAHRSTWNLVVAHQRRRNDPNKPIPMPSTLTKMAMMRKRDQQEDPIGDEEEMDAVDVLEYAGIIEAQQQNEQDTLDMAISMSITSSQNHKHQEQRQQQQQKKKVPLQTTKIKSSIDARGSEPSMTRRTQSTRNNGGRVWGATKHSSTTPRNTSNRQEVSNNDNTITPDLLEHASESDDVEPASTSRPPPPGPGAFNVLPSTYIVGEETEGDEYDLDFEAPETEVNTPNPASDGVGIDNDEEGSPQRYRRDSSYSTGTVLALPVGPEDELMQAQVVGFDISQRQLQYGGTEGDGVEQVEPIERRLQQKTNRMLIRFSIIFVLLVAAAVAIIIVVVSSSNNKGDDSEDVETIPSPAPSVMTPSEALSSSPSFIAPVTTSTPPVPLTLPPASESVLLPTLTPTSPLPTVLLPTGQLTTEQRSFLDLLQIRLPTTSFEDAASPQSKALGWLFSLADETMFGETFVPERWLQLYALVTFFYATDGESAWEEDRAVEWLQIAFDDPPTTECDWPGLRCDVVGNVVDLTLREFGLSGALPPEVGLMTRLRYFITNGRIDLIGGTIPSELGLLTGVFRLNLVGNKLEGTIPTELGLLVDLEYLGLGVNGKLTGTVPTEILSLTKLTDLSLNSNNLEGTIPSGIGLLTDLDQVLLFGNSMTGTLPTELGLLTKLRAALWSDNKFSGTIPSELGRWTGHAILSLSHMRMEGTIPTEFGQMTTFTGLLLEDNLLEGPLPTESLAKLTQLRNLNIDSNDALTGTIPSSLCPANGGPLESLSFNASQVTFDCQSGQ